MYTNNVVGICIFQIVDSSFSHFKQYSTKYIIHFSLQWIKIGLHIHLTVMLSGFVSLRL